MSHDAFGAPSRRRATSRPPPPPQRRRLGTTLAPRPPAAAPSTGGGRRAGHLEEFERFLLKPGPDVFVMDEAHRIKNDSPRRQGAARLSTRKRVLLTGTPLQNNCGVLPHGRFRQPGQARHVVTFKKLFVEHMAQFAARSAGGEQRRRAAADKRAGTLAKKLDNLVQRRGMDILSRTLPPRYDVVVTVRLTEAQRRLYNAAIARTTNKRVFSFQHTAAHLQPGVLLCDAPAAKPARRGGGGAAAAPAWTQTTARRSRT